METADRYRATALDRGLDILELLADQGEGLTRGEIVKAMGRSPSEIYQMLERLVAQASPIGRWEFRVRLGSQLSLLSSASGQTLAIWGAADHLAATQQLWGAGDHIARLGYRLAPSAQLIGVQDISVPIMTQNSQAVAVLTSAYIARPDPAPKHRPSPRTSARGVQSIIGR